MKNINYITVLILFIVHFSCSSETLEQYVEKEQWQQAREYIKQQQQQCYETSTKEKLIQENCLFSKTFATAWLNSQQAYLISKDGNNAAQRKRLLTIARNDYFTILKERPLHSATINNLILILEQLEDRRSLIKLISSLKQANQVVESAEIIAQLSLAKGDQKTAVTYLNRAFQTNHSDGTLSRLLSAFNLKPISKQANMLLKLAQKNKASNLAQTGQIYAAIVNQKAQVDTSTWEQAVLGWVEVQGQTRQLTALLIKQTFNIESEVVYRELYQRLSAPYLGVDELLVKLNRRIMQTGKINGGWWTKNAHRSLALGIAGWSMGHNYLLQGRAKLAHNIWLGALYYAPNPNAYWGVLKDKRAITLELLTDLARLQQVYKSEVDSNGENFKAIENLLFRSKAKAYEVNDLKAINRHHTLLGKLYADLGIFERGYRGAKFQLTNAIKSAKRLAKQNNKTAPAQPLLAKLLAEGYNCKLARQKGNCNKKPVQASNWYQKATIGYISLDALPQANKTLKSAKKLTLSSSPKITEMEIILKARQGVSDKQTKLVIPWIKQKTSSLPSSFVKQQKFRILAEHGLQGNKKSATHALSISKKINVNKSLIDQNRLLKLQKMEKKEGR